MPFSCNNNNLEFTETNTIVEHISNYSGSLMNHENVKMHKRECGCIYTCSKSDGVPAESAWCEYTLYTISKKYYLCSYHYYELKQSQAKRVKKYTARRTAAQQTANQLNTDHRTTRKRKSEDSNNQSSK
jgi:hypothetical protein